MLDFVRTEAAPCTAVVTRVEVPIDEGVVTIDENQLIDWQERPIHRVHVTTGLYLFERLAIGRVLAGTPMDMPGLVRALMPEVTAWHHTGTWFDAGTPDRLRAAERWWIDRRTGRSRVTEMSS